MVYGEWIKRVVLNDWTHGQAAFNARSLNSSTRLTEHRPIWGVGLMLAWICFYGDIFPKWLETTNAVSLVKMKTFCRPQIGCLWTASWVWCTAETVSSAPQQETISLIHSDEDMFLLFFFFFLLQYFVTFMKRAQGEKLFSVKLAYLVQKLSSYKDYLPWISPALLSAYTHSETLLFQVFTRECVKNVAGIAFLAHWWTQHSLQTHQGIEDFKVMFFCIH